jgi:hypothetical protein
MPGGVVGWGGGWGGLLFYSPKSKSGSGVQWILKSPRRRSLRPVVIVGCSLAPCARAASGRARPSYYYYHHHQMTSPPLHPLPSVPPYPSLSLPPNENVYYIYMIKKGEHVRPAIRARTTADATTGHFPTQAAYDDDDGRRRWRRRWWRRRRRRTFLLLLLGGRNSHPNARREPPR